MSYNNIKYNRCSKQSSKGLTYQDRKADALQKAQCPSNSNLRRVEEDGEQEGLFLDPFNVLQ
jgi:hypothetical protein